MDSEKFEENSKANGVLSCYYFGYPNCFSATICSSYSFQVQEGQKLYYKIEKARAAHVADSGDIDEYVKFYNGFRINS